jgi:hypothetical protein
MLPLYPLDVPDFSYFPVNTKFNCLANATDLDRVDVRYYIPPDPENGVTGGWTAWGEGKMSDDVTSGNSAADFHIRWETSQGDVSPLYGRNTTYQGIEPDGSAVDSVAIRAIADDFNRGNEAPEQLGANDPQNNAATTIKIWEVVLTSSRGGQWSPNNNTALDVKLCSAGGKILGKVENGATSTCPSTTCDGAIDGFYDNIEFKGSIPPEVPGAVSGYSFPQLIKGTTKGYNGSSWITTNEHATFVADGATLPGDSVSYAGATSSSDANEVFAIDTPGLVTTCNNSGLNPAYSKMERRYDFLTYFTYNGVAVSTQYAWSDSQSIERDSNGKWQRQ